MTIRMTAEQVAQHQARMRRWAGVLEPHMAEAAASGGALNVTLPIRLRSTANLRAHPLRLWREGKTQENAITKAIPAAILPPLPVVVTITRIGHRKLDTDNLAISAKAVRDQIARLYGVDDGSDLYTWEYAQEKAKPGVHACRITIAPRGELRVTPV